MIEDVLRGHRGAVALVAGLLALGVGGCDTKGGSPAAGPPSPTGAAPPTASAAAATTPAGARVTWRGGVITLPTTLRVKAMDDDTLCLQARSSTNVNACNDHPIEDWVQFYSSERRLGPQQD